MTSICLIGDGGLMFTVQDLMTAAELDMPLAIVMWNNDGYGQIRDGMIQRGIPEIGVSLKNPDHHMLAKAMGCLSLRADTPAALTEALRASLQSPLPDPDRSAPGQLQTVDPPGRRRSAPSRRNRRPPATCVSYRYGSALRCAPDRRGK